MREASNGGFPVTLTVSLTTGQHYRAACEIINCRRLPTKMILYRSASTPLRWQWPPDAANCRTVSVSDTAFFRLLGCCGTYPDSRNSCFSSLSRVTFILHISVLGSVFWICYVFFSRCDTPVNLEIVFCYLDHSKIRLEWIKLHTTSDLYYNYIVVPHIYVVSNHVATDKLTSQNCCKFRNFPLMYYCIRLWS